MDVAFLFVLLLCTFVLADPQVNDNDEEFSKKEFTMLNRWYTIDFKWPNHHQYKNLPYTPENVYVSQIRVRNDTIFLALPRIKNGVPATMATLLLTDTNDKRPPVRPFPSWDLNVRNDCDGLQSVHTFEIDTDSIMWIVDNGNKSHYKQHHPHCKPSLVFIDLNGDSTVLTRYIFPDDVVGKDSYLKDIVVDNYKEGYAYIVDNSRTDPGIVVYSRSDDKSWKFKDLSCLREDPHMLITCMQNSRFKESKKSYLSKNINTIALGPYFKNNSEEFERYVLFSSLYSYKIYAVYASWLRNETVATTFSNSLPGDVMDFGDKLDLFDGMIMDENGYFYYGTFCNKTVERCMILNSTSECESLSIGQISSVWFERFTFDDNGNLYVMMTKFFEFLHNNLLPTKINFMLIRTNVGSRSYLYATNETNKESNSDEMLKFNVSLLFYILIIKMFITSM